MYQSDLVGEFARSWTYRSWGSSGAYESCFSPFGQWKSSHQVLNSFDLKKSKTKQYETNCNWSKSGKVLYHVSPSPSVPEVDQDERPHTHDVPHGLKQWRDGQLSGDNGTTTTGTWKHPVGVLCFSNLVTMNGVKISVIKTQRRKKTLFAGMASIVTDHKWGTQPDSDHTCRPNYAVNVSQHVWSTRKRQGTLNNSQQPQLSQALWIRKWHHRRNDLTRPRQTDRRCLSPMSA